MSPDRPPLKFLYAGKSGDPWFRKWNAEPYLHQWPNPLTDRERHPECSAAGYEALCMSLRKHPPEDPITLRNDANAYIAGILEKMKARVQAGYCESDLLDAVEEHAFEIEGYMDDLAILALTAQADARDAREAEHKAARALEDASLAVVLKSVRAEERMQAADEKMKAAEEAEGRVRKMMEGMKPGVRDEGDSSS